LTSRAAEPPRSAPVISRWLRVACLGMGRRFHRGANPLPIDATLTGTFTPTVITESDLSVHTTDGGFTTSFSDSSTLVDGDLGIIYATESGGAVPEPAWVSWMLQGYVFPGPGDFPQPAPVGEIPGDALNPGVEAGTSGISIAPGTNLGIVSGEFTTNRISVILLPSTSGARDPGCDYAATDLEASFSLGFDPHTLTAYTSPNDGNAYGVLAGSTPPTVPALVNLGCVIAAARIGVTHNVDPTVTAACIRYVATH
jgi:hypothetical protein